MKKLLMLMKLCLLFICVFTLTLSASSFAQQERVSFDLKNVSVKVLLDEIQKQTNWCFLFNPEHTKQLVFTGYMKRYSDISEILDAITDVVGVNFTINGKTIIVSK